MNLLTLKEIETEVNRLAKIINAPQDGLPTYGFSRDFAYPHIEVDARGYHYVIVERGEELKRETTLDLQELLFLIFKDVTFSMATQYELKNRIKDKDCRRMYFIKQEELLGLLDPQWAVKQKEYHADILKIHPFNDQ